MRRFLLVVWIFILAGCGTEPATPPPPTLETSEQAPDPTAPPPTPTDAPPTVWISPGAPPELATVVEAAAVGFERSATPEDADLRLVINPAEGAALTAEWVYAVAAPFTTVQDGIGWQNFQQYWLEGATLGFAQTPSLVASSQVTDLLIGQIGALNGAITLYDATSSLWDVQPAVSVLPFGQLEPSLKVLAVDGQNPLDKTFDPTAYPLTVRFGVEATTPEGEQVVAGINGWQATNRDPAQLQYVVLTGTTAIARATAMQVEYNGVGYPSAAIAPFFADADVLHTSNESSYAVDCPPPDWYGEPKFCSQRKYFDVLTTAGVDIVEKTGNHVVDYGRNSLSYTLDVYDGNGIVYYGGGRNLADATAARILTLDDGTRVAFVGCNSAGPFGAWATEAAPGAAPCGDNWASITETIQNLKANNEADVVIATLQYLELPSYEPSAEQIADFQRLADAGADIISGSQAHQPQGFGFTNGAFIHYGIGNLFFDQMDFIENRQMFADKHVIYGGEHISTILFTGLMYEWAQPRPMEAEERREFLQTIFDVSPGYLP